MTPEEMLTSLLGRTIEGVEIDDDCLYLELDDDRVFGFYIDDEGDMNISIMGQKAN